MQKHAGPGIQSPRSDAALLAVADDIRKAAAAKAEKDGSYGKKLSVSKIDPLAEDFEGYYGQGCDNFFIVNSSTYERNSHAAKYHGIAKGDRETL